MKSFGNFVRSAALATATFFGCGSDECYSYNDSTITLNQETDGVVARLTELEQESSTKVLNDEVIDFVNEVHAHTLSTAGLPRDTRVTSVSDSCFRGSSGEDFPPLGTTYHPEYTAMSGDVGVYVRGNKTIDGVFFVNHGVGHLQPAGYLGESANSEVIPQINAFEKSLAGLVLLSPEDRAKYWLEYEARTFGLEYRIPIVINDIQNGWIAPEHVEEYLTQLINAADIFIFLGLEQHQGNFAELRAETERLAEQGSLQNALEDGVREFMQRYPPLDFQRYEPRRNVDIAEANAITTIRLSHFNYIYERAGPDAAMAYFTTTALFPTVPIYERIIVGIGDLNCSMLASEREWLSELPSCEGQEQCDRLGAQYISPIEMRLCCFEVQGDTLKKSVVDASGRLYTRFLGKGPMHSNGMDVDGIYEVEIGSQRQIGVEEMCR